MRRILEFDDEDIDEWEIYNNAPEMHCALTELKAYMRNLNKHDLPDTKEQIIARVNEILWQAID